MNKNLNKILFLCFTFLFFFSFNIKNVNALSYKNDELIEIMNVNNYGVVPAEENTCASYLGSVDNPEEPAYWLQYILNLMKYAAIIALFVLVTFDFMKAIVENDKDAIKKAGQKAIKRFIYCVLIFFLPIIVEFLMELFGIYENCGIS
ncbi:hypothetical protein EGR52_02495 [bacterium]|nr:hypothetical protein [bacterium]